MRAAVTNPFPAILDFMKQNMQRLEVGARKEESLKQHESRATRHVTAHGRHVEAVAVEEVSQAKRDKPQPTRLDQREESLPVARVDGVDVAARCARAAAQHALRPKPCAPAPKLAIRPAAATRPPAVSAAMPRAVCAQFGVGVWWKAGAEVAGVGGAAATVAYFTARLVERVVGE